MFSLLCDKLNAIEEIEKYGPEIQNLHFLKFTQYVDTAFYLAIAP